MGQYFSNDELKSELRIFTTHIFDREYSFYTDNGVFSKDKLDFGTRTLLESIPIHDLTGNVLDVGCGYGVIEVILGKVTSANYEGLDVNRRALHLAEMNAKLNGVTNVRFYESNTYECVNKKYNFIITNPPIRAGKKVVYDIVMNARNYLLDNGVLYIVIRKEQGAKSMMRDLEKYYKVEVINKNKGFFVIKCVLH
ncbi:MAG: class I SAM-dependent methyltransferase [Bacilli bacterium]|nr:class I SAM-dependent methyltransferase [Bacilli bacterium]